MRDTPVMLEIKKERFRRHLDEVEGYLKEWLGQLHAPKPFRAPVYQPALEGDADVKHMLRRHVHSRTFWKHHAQWEQRLAEIGRLRDQLLKVGNRWLVEAAKKSQISPTELILEAALEDAFTLASGEKVQRQDPEVRTGGGVDYGGYRIEEGSLAEQVEQVTVVLEGLTGQLKGRDEMKAVVGYWSEIRRVEESMRKIGTTALKSSDIFYPCRFCRKLSK